jgi:hypothetical protein
LVDAVACDLRRERAAFGVVVVAVVTKRGTVAVEVVVGGRRVAVLIDAVIGAFDRVRPDVGVVVCTVSFDGAEAITVEVERATRERDPAQSSSTPSSQTSTAPG